MITTTTHSLTIYSGGVYYMNIFKLKNVNSEINNTCKLSKLIGVLLFSLMISQAVAQYEITKHTISNGGGTSTGGNYVIKSSVGQVVASQPLTGGDYQINSGFWQENQNLIYKNGFEN